ncbi:MAG TPA: 16S rRNA (guanine(527)-N(7))-methyltransferase RsmG [Terriglobales bacterium]|nr:16S rRNA (guanine(527)-N(7))-methyltransferase RsmG [Terriglobales bacterium]
MEAQRIAALLRPFAAEALAAEQLAAISTHLDLLLRWNQRINLTAVRSPEEVVTRHFGESIFAGEELLAPHEAADVCDLGSGAGFPGLPLKMVRTEAHVLLVEAHGKKAVFLKEVVRATKLQGIEVAAVRAERLDLEFDLVTLRAVERFADVLPIAAKLVRTGGRLGLLIGAAQVEEAARALPSFKWQTPAAIPQSNARVLLQGKKLQLHLS